MRNIVGQPVSGNDFFQRDSIVNKLYRRLDSGSSLYMAAPRRVGKTSIMYHLRDLPREGYSFIYVPTEAVDSSELFFLRLFQALLNSDAVSQKIKVSEKGKQLIELAAEKVKKIGAFGVELELKSKKDKYSDVFIDLTKRMDASGIKIVMLIDEFPSTIENIAQKYDDAEAVRFLKVNRMIRQESAGGIQFIYTGSIGLPSVVNRLGTPESINDLNSIEVPPLSLKDGKIFVMGLLDEAGVPFEGDSINTLLDKIKWLMPFFIQLSVQELIDTYDSNQKIITSETVKEAFTKICSRRNNIHFDSYYKRLESTFSKEDYEVSLTILGLISKNTELKKAEIFQNLGGQLEEKRISSIMESLEYDGYINLTSDKYSFNSPILREWWNKYIGF